MLLAACGGYGGGGGYNGAAPAPTVTLSVAPTSIVLGQSATLTWSSTNSSTLHRERRLERQSSRIRYQRADTDGGRVAHLHADLQRRERRQRREIGEL